MRYHVRTHWSKDDDWSGIHEAERPEEALAEARHEVSSKANVTEDFLNANAHFTVSRAKDYPR